MPSSPELPTSPDLSAENLALRQQLEELTAHSQTIQTLLVEVNRKLQLSSASIKAAVSSLLTPDFFWDASAQHEFLQTIDDSVNQASELISLVALAFQIETDSLHIHREPQMLQEILAAVLDEITAKHSSDALRLNYPDDGRLVLVDFEYLKIALKLLLEGILPAEPRANPILITALENPSGWLLRMDGIDPQVLEQVIDVVRCVHEILTSIQRMQPDKVLMILLANQLFKLLGIQIELADHKPAMQLVIPAVA